MTVKVVYIFCFNPSPSDGVSSKILISEKYTLPNYYFDKKAKYYCKVAVDKCAMCMPVCSPTQHRLTLCASFINIHTIKCA